MAFCANCGNRVEEYDKFCPKCGVATRKDYFSDSSAQSVRKESYDGEIKKCPNCGEVLKSFNVNCPACGYELRNSTTSNYIQEFSKQLERATTVQQKEEIIRHFIIPNTKEDIYEFMILAAANIETDGKNSDAWFAKLEQAYQKSKIIWKDSTVLKPIEGVYFKANQQYQKNKRVKTFSAFIHDHTKGIVICLLGIVAFICYSIGVMGTVNDNYNYGIFNSFGFIACLAIIFIAIKWKKHGG